MQLKGRPEVRAGHPTAPFSAGETWETFFGLCPSHAAIPRQELCNAASRAAVRGWKQVGKASAVPTPAPTRELRGTTARSGQLGSGWALTRAKNASLRRRDRGLRSAWEPSLSRAGSAAARVPGLSEEPEHEVERRPKATRGGCGGGRSQAASIANGNSALALSVRAPGLPAAPRSRPRRPGCPFGW